MFVICGAPHCACRGTRYLRHLAVDHVDGQAKKMKGEKGVRGGSALWYHLKDNGYPSGFQILCHNRNIAKHRLGRCGCQDPR